MSIARMVKNLQVLCAFKIHITNKFFSKKIRPLSELTDWTNLKISSKDDVSVLVFYLSISPPLHRNYVPSFLFLRQLKNP